MVFLYFKSCLSVMLNSLWCSFTNLSFITNITKVNAMYLFIYLFIFFSGYLEMLTSIKEILTVART